jgi:hypothetical protein
MITLADINRVFKNKIKTGPDEFGKYTTKVYFDVSTKIDGKDLLLQDYEVVFYDEKNLDYEELSGEEKANHLRYFVSPLYMSRFGEIIGDLHTLFLEQLKNR